MFKTGKTAFGKRRTSSDCNSRKCRKASLHVRKTKNPKRILEIGTLAGYSTLWLAKGAPDAEIFTIECNAQHTAVARKIFQHADLERRVHLLEGNALDILSRFIQRKDAPFDLIF
ncbi:MAG: class I SAM-dependent methyltransferase [Parachlamydiaceae bacterium]|nr:MAG: class I SAM-dependent methyltransferase [Parachlamydiaceae bacterium]